MNATTAVALTLGAVALAGGGYYLYRQSQGQPQRAQGGPSASSWRQEQEPQQAQLPQPQPPAPAQPSPADVMAELQRQQAALAEQQRQADIRGFIDRIAATENLQFDSLVLIDAVNENDAPREDFRQAWLNEQINSGRFAQMAEGCKRAVTHNCGMDWNQSCRGWGHPRCESRETVLDGRFQGAWTQGRDRGDKTPNPWGFLNEESQAEADKRVKEWARKQRRPHEVKLAQREWNYRGMVEELKRRYGVDYSPQQANAHTRAAPLVAAGLHKEGEGPSGYAVA